MGTHCLQFVMIESMFGVEGHQLAVAALLGAYLMCLMPHVLRAYYVLQVRKGKYNLENFGVFAAGVLASILMGATPGATACWAVTYVILRFFFNLHYVFNANPKLGFIRSTIWIACLVCVIALYVNAFKAAAPSTHS